jgi:hypothetical protein
MADTDIGHPSLSNLLWVLPDRPRRRLLGIHGGTSPLVRALRGQFSEFEELPLDAVCADPAGFAASAVLKRPDLVVLDLADAQPPYEDALGRWISAFAMLEPSMRPLLAVHFNARGRHRATSRVTGVMRDLERRSARVERLYYVSPSLAKPFAFVPIDARAVCSFDALSPRSPLRWGARRLLIVAGLHDLLFEDVVMVVAP